MANVLTSNGNNQAPSYQSITGIEGITAARKIASGQTVVAQATTSDVATFTRNAGERVVPLGFVTNDVADLELIWNGLAAVTGPQGIGIRRTVNPGEAKLSITNSSAASSRTHDWMILGIVP